MADVKAVNMHKRRAMGENVTGMKKGGAVKEPKTTKVGKVEATNAGKTNMKKGGKC